MFPDDTRKKIKNITEGIIIEGSADNCTTVRNLFCAGFSTSTTVKTDFESKAIVKEDQAIQLVKYSTENNGWVKDLRGENGFLTNSGNGMVNKHLHLNGDERNLISLHLHPIKPAFAYTPNGITTAIFHY